MNLFDFSLFSVGIAAEMIMFIMIMVVPLSIAPPYKIIPESREGNDSKGKTIFVDIHKTDTVADLKTKTEEKLKIKPERQKLKHNLCNSAWLEKNKKLKDLVGKPTFYLSEIKLDKFEIKLKYGKVWKNIEVQRTDTVAQLREKVKDMFKIPLESLTISKWGSSFTLNDNTKTMDECNIRKKEKICVSWDKFEIKVKHGQKEWSVEVEATDFLFDLKKKIKDLTDIPTKRQKLRFPDLTKLVERNMVFNDIVKGDTILLEDVFKISVSYKLESPYNVIGSDKVEVNAGDTVQILKAKIYAMIKVNWHNYAREVAEMKLKNKYGETLANDNGTIEENGIKEEGDEIYVNFI